MSSTRTIQRYHSGSLPFAVDVFLDTYEGHNSIRQFLRGKSGWLQLSLAKMVTPISTWRTTLIAARTDDGQALNKATAGAFLAMRSSGPRELDLMPPAELDTQSDMLFWDFLGGCDLKHLRMLSDAEAERDQRVTAEQARGELVLAQADTYIADLQRQRRALGIASEARAKLTEAIGFFEQKHEAAAAWLVRRLAGIRDEVAALEADVLEALQHHGEVEELYTVRWTARHPMDRKVTLLPYWSSTDEWLKNAAGQFDQQRGRTESGVPDRRSVSMPIQGRLGDRFRQLEPPRQPGSAQLDPVADLAVSLLSNKAATPSVRTITEKSESERARVSANAERLRTAAQQASARRRDDKLARERAITEVVRQFPTLPLLEARLAALPSVGIENRRLARLLRIAIWRVSNGRMPAPADDEEVAS